MPDADPLSVLRLAIQHATENEMSGHDTRRLLSDALDRAEERIAAHDEQVRAAERKRCIDITETVFYPEADDGMERVMRDEIIKAIRATPAPLADSPS